MLIFPPKHQEGSARLFMKKFEQLLTAETTADPYSLELERYIVI